MRIAQKRGTTPMASRSLGWRFAYIALFAGTLGACDQITSLDQEAPSRVLANDLYKPENAQLLVTSTISDFECALAQYVVASSRWIRSTSSRARSVETRRSPRRRSKIASFTFANQRSRPQSADVKVMSVSIGFP